SEVQASHLANGLAAQIYAEKWGASVLTATRAKTRTLYMVSCFFRYPKRSPYRPLHPIGMIQSSERETRCLGRRTRVRWKLLQPRASAVMIPRRTRGGCRGYLPTCLATAVSS